MTSDPHRPRYHFLPPAKWMNDPNGLIQWGEIFHLFYQYNPTGTCHRNIHWGHATSADLLYWQHQPIALTPTPGGLDADGCWSGCAINDHGIPTLIYTGFRLPDRQTPCLAVSHDGLLTWQKWPEPIIPMPPSDLDLLGFRDHSVWREDDGWCMLIGAGIRGQGGTALLYRSSDLRRWEYGGPLLVGDAGQFAPIWTGTLWECPDFFAIGQEHVLICSVWDQRPYYTIAMRGNYYGGRFTPQTIHKLDDGDAYFYAPQTMPICDGRRIMFGWVMEGRSESAVLAAGWAGVMSLPREVRLTSDGRVVALPIAEVRQLRGAEQRVAPGTIDPSAPQWVPIRGAHLELEATLLPPPQGTCSVWLRASPDGAEATIVRYESATATLILDRSRSSLARDVWRDAHRTYVPLSRDEPLYLRIFLDGSLIEVFANERRSITSRIYPTRLDSVGIALQAEGGSVEVVAMRAWEMANIWA
ncbi:glycoside hydrolase family 32 protein [uncultured Chloroflexus sp.]|uniref:glycoside hydrolase family 32 protein n=2 Tax=uncultured Chloroflexus sp. TaxID=214040 RepID=UPI00263242DF|nr:glycoside hydrolase family 32 protein [uncultured Chloroflexus sp.]